MRLVCLLGLLVLVLACEGAVSVNHLNALMDLFNATNGLKWKRKTNWGVGDPCANTWQNLICSNNEIQYAYFEANDLNGTLPSSIGDLTLLTFLKLASNSLLSGTIPPSIGQLTRLNTLTLDMCALEGTIPPSIGNLVLMQDLSFGNSPMNGTIPDLSNLTSLTSLSLTHSKVSGTIPEYIGTFTSLNFLSLMGNHLSGTIPLSFQQLRNINFLELINGNSICNGCLNLIYRNQCFANDQIFFCSCPSSVCNNSCSVSTINCPAPSPEQPPLSPVPSPPPSPVSTIPQPSPVPTNIPQPPPIIQPSPSIPQPSPVSTIPQPSPVPTNIPQPPPITEPSPSPIFPSISPSPISTSIPLPSPFPITQCSGNASQYGTCNGIWLLDPLKMANNLTLKNVIGLVLGTFEPNQLHLQESNLTINGDLQGRNTKLVLYDSELQLRDMNVVASEVLMDTHSFISVLGNVNMKDSTLVVTLDLGQVSGEITLILAQNSSLTIWPTVQLIYLNNAQACQTILPKQNKTSLSIVLGTHLDCNDHTVLIIGVSVGVFMMLVLLFGVTYFCYQKQVYKKSFRQLATTILLEQ